MSRRRMIFVPAPAAPAATITLGRSNSAVVKGAGSSLTLGWASGGAAAAGRMLVVIARDNIGNSISLSGGAAWTQLGTDRIWYKIAGAGEPASYGLTFAGSNKDESESATILEIIGATSMYASLVGTNTNTPPARTSTGANDLAVIVGGYGGFGVTGVITPPAGFTLQSKHDSSTDAGLYNTVLTAIAAKTAVGVGTVTPGAWTITNSLVFQKVATLLFA